MAAAFTWLGNGRIAALNEWGAIKAFGGKANVQSNSRSNWQPFHNWLVALIPVVLLLVLLAVLRLSAWLLAVLIGSIVTFLLALWVWKMPLDDGVRAYLYGSATGIWYVDWITFWGVILFNTLVTTGSFDKLRRWLVQQGTRDVRVQTILFFAWAFGALLEGLVGFGYPWAFVAPILIAIGIPDLDAIPVAAIADDPAGFLRSTGSADYRTCHRDRRHARRSIPRSVANLLGLGRQDRGDPRTVAALDPALSGVGQQRHVVGVAARDRRFSWLHRWATADRGCSLGPYLPDVIGAIVCFVVLLLLLKVWRPAQVLAYGGVPVTGETRAEAHGLSAGDVGMAWLPIAVLVAVVVAWTGPWSSLPKIIMLHMSVAADSAITPGAKISATFNWTPVRSRDRRSWYPGSSRRSCCG